MRIWNKCMLVVGIILGSTWGNKAWAQEKGCFKVLVSPDSEKYNAVEGPIEVNGKPVVQEGGMLCLEKRGNVPYKILVPDFYMVIAYNKGGIWYLRRMTGDPSRKPNDAPITMEGIILNRKIENREVVITGNRQEEDLNASKQSMELVKPEFLLKTQTTNLTQALEKISGVQVQKEQLVVRGGSGFSYGTGSRVMLLLDEMPLISADASDIKWSYLPMENLQALELLKGAGSSLYGSSAIEGVLHLRGAVPTDSAQYQVRTFAGWYDSEANPAEKIDKPRGRRQYGNSLAYSGKSGNVGVVASVYQFDDMGYRIEDNQQNLRGNLKVYYQPKANDKWLIWAAVNGMKRTGEEFLLAADVAQPNVELANTGVLFNHTRYHVDLGAKYYQSIDAMHVIRGRQYVTRGETSGSQNSVGTSTFGEYQYQNKLAGGKNWTLKNTSGLSVMHLRVQSEALYGDHNAINPAAYTQLDLEWGKLKLGVGGRVEGYQIDSAELQAQPVGRVALNYEVYKGGFVRASVGQGLRYPSIGERFNLTQAGAIKVFGNNELKNERGLNQEIGFRQLFKSGSWKGFVDASGFMNRYRDMIEYQFGAWLPKDSPASAIFNYFGFKAINVSNTLVMGGELSFGVEWNPNEKMQYTAWGGYTYVNPRNLDTVLAAGTEERFGLLKYRRPHLIRLNQEFRYKRVEVGLYYNYNSAFTNIDEFFIELVKGLKENNYWQAYSEAHVVDARVSYLWRKDWSIGLNIKNIGNAAYMEIPGNQSAPRLYLLQVTGKF